MATLIETGHVILAKAGIQKDTEFGVKPGMTNSRKFMSLCIKTFKYRELKMVSCEGEVVTNNSQLTTSQLTLFLNHPCVTNRRGSPLRAVGLGIHRVLDSCILQWGN